MKGLSLALLCVMAASCNAYYARRYGYRNYGGYRGYDRRLGHGSGSRLDVGSHGGHDSHGNHARVSPGVGINHIDTEVTHIPHGDHVHTITRKVPHVYAGNSQTQVIHGHVGSGAHGPLASGLGLTNGPLASGLGLAQGHINSGFGQGPLSSGFGMAQGPLGSGLGFNGPLGPRRLGLTGNIHGSGIGGFPLRGPLSSQGGVIADQIRESHIHDAHAHEAAAREAHVHDVLAHDHHAHDVLARDHHAHDAHGHDIHEIHRGVPGPFFQTAPGVFQRSLG